MATKNNSSKVIGLLIIVIIAAIVAIIALNHNNGSLSSSQIAADKTQITSNWKEFFAYSTPQAQRENLLQNGKQFASVIQSEFQALGSAKSSVSVNNITVTNATNASVNYTVYLNSQPALTNQSGTAIKENNNWLVSDSTLCGLLSLAGSKPTACTNS